jgi:uncharacterized OB-fold protein
MNPFLRELQANHPEGVEGVITGVNHVVRSPAEVKAKAEQHYLVEIKVGELLYIDVVDSKRELQAGDQVKVEWTKTQEGDGMPLLS